jgi:hypothetical protein
VSALQHPSPARVPLFVQRLSDGGAKLRFIKGTADQDSQFGGIPLCKRPGSAVLSGRPSNDFLDSLSSLVQIGVARSFFVSFDVSEAEFVDVRNPT